MCTARARYALCRPRQRAAIVARGRHGLLALATLCADNVSKLRSVLSTGDLGMWGSGWLRFCGPVRGAKSESPLLSARSERHRYYVNRHLKRTSCPQVWVARSLPKGFLRSGCHGLPAARAVRSNVCLLTSEAVRNRSAIKQTATLLNCKGFGSQSFGGRGCFEACLYCFHPGLAEPHHAVGSASGAGRLAQWFARSAVQER